MSSPWKEKSSKIPKKFLTFPHKNWIYSKTGSVTFVTLWWPCMQDKTEKSWAESEGKINYQEPLSINLLVQNKLDHLSIIGLETEPLRQLSNLKDIRHGDQFYLHGYFYRIKLLGVYYLLCTKQLCMNTKLSLKSSNNTDNYLT